MEWLSKDGLSQAFLDPLTKQLMTEVVVLTCCGYSVSKSTIQGKSNCPLCEEVVTSASYIPNKSLQAQIEQYVEKKISTSLSSSVFSDIENLSPESLSNIQNIINMVGSLCSDVNESEPDKPFRGGIYSKVKNVLLQQYKENFPTLSKVFSTKLQKESKKNFLLFLAINQEVSFFVQTLKLFIETDQTPLFDLKSELVLKKLKLWKDFENYSEITQNQKKMCFELIALLQQSSQNNNNNMLNSYTQVVGFTVESMEIIVDALEYIADFSPPHVTTTLIETLRLWRQGASESSNTQTSNNSLLLGLKVLFEQMDEYLISRLFKIMIRFSSEFNIKMIHSICLLESKNLKLLSDSVGGDFLDKVVLPSFETPKSNRPHTQSNEQKPLTSTESSSSGSSPAAELAFMLVKSGYLSLEKVLSSTMGSKVTSEKEDTEEEREREHTLAEKKKAFMVSIVEQLMLSIGNEKLSIEEYSKAILNIVHLSGSLSSELPTLSDRLLEFFSFHCLWSCLDSDSLKKVAQFLFCLGDNNTEQKDDHLSNQTVTEETEKEENKGTEIEEEEEREKKREKEEMIIRKLKLLKTLVGLSPLGSAITLNEVKSLHLASYFSSPNPRISTSSVQLATSLLFVCSENTLSASTSNSSTTNITSFPLTVNDLTTEPSVVSQIVLHQSNVINLENKLMSYMFNMKNMNSLEQFESLRLILSFEHDLSNLISLSFLQLFPKENHHHHSTSFTPDLSDPDSSLNIHSTPRNKAGESSITLEKQIGASEQLFKIVLNRIRMSPKTNLPNLLNLLSVFVRCTTKGSPSCKLYPEVLKLVLSLLRSHTGNSIIQLACLDSLKYLTTKLDIVSSFDSPKIQQLLETIEQNEWDHSIQISCLVILANLASDVKQRDNVRNEGGIKLILSILKENAQEEKVHKFGLLSLFNLTVRNVENQIQIRSHNGIPLILSILQNFPHSIEVQRYALKTIGSLATEDTNRTAITTADGIEVVLKSLSSSRNHDVVEEGLGALWSLAGNLEQKQQIESKDGIKKILDCFQNFPHNSGVHQKGIGALSRLAAVESISKQIRAAGAIKILFNCLMNNNDEPILLERGFTLLNILCSGEDPKEKTKDDQFVIFLLGRISRPPQTAETCRIEIVKQGISLVNDMIISEDVKERVRSANGVSLLLEVLTKFKDDLDIVERVLSSLNKLITPPTGASISQQNNVGSSLSSGITPLLEVLELHKGSTFVQKNALSLLKLSGVLPA